MNAAAPKTSILSLKIESHTLKIYDHRLLHSFYIECVIKGEDARFALWAPPASFPFYPNSNRMQEKKENKKSFTRVKFYLSGVNGSNVKRTVDFVERQTFTSRHNEINK